MTRTSVQHAGDAAERLVARMLAAAGWTVLGRNVRVGRAELDIVAVDPGPPARLVVLEVRWRASREWGLPEETVDRRKVARLRGALGALLGAGRLPDGTPLPRASPAIDIVAVEPSGACGRAGPGAPRIRHHRDVG